MSQIRFKTVFIIFVVLLFALIYLYHKQTSQDAVENAHVKIEELLLNYKAFRSYVSNKQKQEVYKLQDNSVLDYDYFNPALLSSTYSARNVNIIYNRIRNDFGLKSITLKFASDNPRNSVNKATQKELLLLKQFNDNKIKKYSEIIDTENGKAIYYAVPTQKTVAKCMKCHSNPSFAPKGLIELYGNSAGFYEEMNNIRALLSVTYPIDKDLASAKIQFWKLTFVTVFIFALLLLLVYTLINKKNELELAVEKALEENIKQLQTIQEQTKMASMGEMIGAIAHQWRQPLNELGLSIQNLKYDYRANAIDEKFIEKFIDYNKKTIMFMSKTIDDFRSFFRVDKEKKDFKVKETTESVIAMQSAQLKDHGITVTINGEEFVYNGFKSEYQQVVLNIVNNAKDALTDNNIENPTIEIKLQNNRVTIKDNAGGVPEDIRERIFEPYFTTKEQGKGTGMGLYMSKMIIEDNMDGKLSLINESDGACFTIDFN